MTSPRKKPGRAPSATNLNALTQELLAEMHGVTGRTIVNWDKDGHPRNDDGSYTAADSIRWRLDREIHQGISLEAERAKLAKAQQEKANLELAARRGELLESSMVISKVSDLLAATKSRLRALPQRIRPELLGKTPRDQTIAIASAIDICLLEMSDAAFVRSVINTGRSAVDRDRDERRMADTDLAHADTTADADGESVGGQAPHPVKRGKQ